MTSNSVIKGPCRIDGSVVRKHCQFTCEQRYKGKGVVRWCELGCIDLPVVWGPHDGQIHYHLYDDADGGEVQVIGENVLTDNGHMSFSPVDKRWLLSDTYPDAATHERILFLYDMQTGQRHDIGSFRADPALSKENRCDLHPRWRRDGRAVCIDSVHGTNQGRAAV